MRKEISKVKYFFSSCRLLHSTDEGWDFEAADSNLYMDSYTLNGKKRVISMDRH